VSQLFGGGAKPAVALAPPTEIVRQESLADSVASLHTSVSSSMSVPRQQSFDAATPQTTRTRRFSVSQLFKRDDSPAQSGGIPNSYNSGKRSSIAQDFGMWRTASESTADLASTLNGPPKPRVYTPPTNAMGLVQTTPKSRPRAGSVSSGVMNFFQRRSSEGSNPVTNWPAAGWRDAEGTQPSQTPSIGSGSNRPVFPKRKPVPTMDGYSPSLPKFAAPSPGTSETPTLYGRSIPAGMFNRTQMANAVMSKQNEEAIASDEESVDPGTNRVSKFLNEYAGTVPVLPPLDTGASSLHWL